MATPERIDSVAETMDAPPDLADSGPREQRAVALVAGSTPHLSSETQTLLRSRIRAAGLVLFAGFLAFTIKSFFYLETFHTPLERVLFALAGSVTLLSALLAATLSPWFLLLTAFVGANQWLYVIFGACPSSLLLSRIFGLRSALYPRDTTR